MSSNYLELYFRATDVNGYPSIRLLHNGSLLQDLKISQSELVLKIALESTIGQHTVQVERYGKDHTNQFSDRDQILEITDIKIDGVSLPINIITPHFKFEFADQCHVGSLYFGPNGMWTFNFSSPAITWLLDQKILHESQYNQDYKFPWSYKLGPDSVENLQNELSNVIERVNKIL